MDVILREEARYDVPNVPLASPEFICVTVCFHVVVGEHRHNLVFSSSARAKLYRMERMSASIPQICTGNCFY